MERVPQARVAVVCDRPGGLADGPFEPLGLRRERIAEARLDVYRRQVAEVAEERRGPRVLAVGGLWRVRRREVGDERRAQERLGAGVGDRRGEVEPRAQHQQRVRGRQAEVPGGEGHGRASAHPRRSPRRRSPAAPGSERAIARDGVVVRGREQCSGRDRHSGAGARRRSSRLGAALRPGAAARIAHAPVARVNSRTAARRVRAITPGPGRPRPPAPGGNPPRGARRASGGGAAGPTATARGARRGRGTSCRIRWPTPFPAARRAARR